MVEQPPFLASIREASVRIGYQSVYVFAPRGHTGSSQATLFANGARLRTNHPAAAPTAAALVDDVTRFVTT